MSLKGILPWMRLVDRRTFLQQTGAAAAAMTLVRVSCICGVVDAAEPSSVGLDDGVVDTLVRVSRDIYPHDKLPDDVYRQAVLPYAAAAAHDVSLRKLLNDGVASLEAEANRRFASPYSGLSREADRATLLRSIDATVFFRRLQSDLLYTLYNDKAVWPALGYEGSSWEKGGYLQRGFNDIDWL